MKIIVNLVVVLILGTYMAFLVGSAVQVYDRNVFTNLNAQLSEAFK